MTKTTPLLTKTARATLKAHEALMDVAVHTPLEYSERLSRLYQAEVFLKREDLQPVRSYKIRGAYTLIHSLSPEERARGVVCASAGNHAQGVAYSCKTLGIRGTIFMPETTPRQKVDKVRFFGDTWVDIKLVGKTFDESNAAALAFADTKHAVYAPPFDDPRTIAGQGTVAKEILADAPDVDVVVHPIGGGGLIAGCGAYFATHAPQVQIIGAEPSGALGMLRSLEAGRVVTLKDIDPFVDGAAVKKVGSKTFAIAKQVVSKIVSVPEGAVCTTMIELYQKEGIIAEPAGALAIAALDELASALRGKRVVVVVSGGNNDISRYPEVIERSLVFQGLKHYFIIEFFQKPGELRTFVTEALGPGDDITRFEYIKKTNKEKGPALVGVELSQKEDLKPLLARMDTLGIRYKHFTSDDVLYSVLI